MLETFEIKDNGEIKISDDVISIIATTAALSVDGVGQMSGSFAEDISTKFKFKTNDTKGVKVDFENGTLNLELFILIDYGYKVVDIAKKVQSAVKESILMMTDMDIKKIDIYVEGIHLEKTNKLAKFKLKN